MLCNDECRERLNDAFDYLYKDYEWKDEIEFYIDKEYSNVYEWEFYVPEQNVHAKLTFNKETEEIKYTDDCGKEAHIDG